MKNNRLFSLLLACAAIAPMAQGALVEPENSVMASGHWVKIRVDQDGVYAFTDARLRELGFSDPAKVKVFGYQPNILMTHDLDKIPVDLSPLASVRSSDDSKLIFYAKTDLNLAPELWTVTNDVSSNLHDKHVYGIGATYFLSDAEGTVPEITTSAAPSDYYITAAEYHNTHTSLVYHEEDAENLADGGIWFTGHKLYSIRPEETQPFTVSKVADSGAARFVYKGVLSPKTQSTHNYLLTRFSDDIKSEQSTGSYAMAIGDSHIRFSQAMRFQNLELPVADEPRTYEVTFSVHPQAGSMGDNNALDFFALLYERKNELQGETNIRMFYENLATSALEFTGYEAGWKFWNVSSGTPVEMLVNNNADPSVAYLALAKTTATKPNEVYAFNETAELPEPVVLGQVANQNLHAMETPDLVILTTAALMNSGEFVADIHRKYQGLDVAVVDQQLVFNEFSSGNNSPEGIRRFMRHLDLNTPDKLHGLLLLGRAHYDNAHRVTPDGTYVLVPECEDYDYSLNITRNFPSDAFYGHLGARANKSLWKTRNNMFRILGNDMEIAVGRVPFGNHGEIEKYYKKVLDYITNPPKNPIAGNILLASDYHGDVATESHFPNAEAVTKALGSRIGDDLTAFRAACNLYSSSDNDMVKKIFNMAFEKGAQYCLYMGHGNPTALMSFDSPMTRESAGKMVNPGNYPLFFLGSCSVGVYDNNSSNVTTAMVGNPDGGAIAVISSAREVYQAMNQALGVAVAQEFYKSKKGDWLGDVWRRAHTNAIQVDQLAKKNVANHLAYSYTGDPALPAYPLTNSAEITSVNSDGILKMKASNTVEGQVLNLDGTVATDFNGMVSLTVYDVPYTLTNLLGASPTGAHKDYIGSVTADFEEIGEFIGEVKNGKFSVSFIGPVTSREGTHRIRAYVVSDDSQLRGLGARKDVAMTYDPENIETPEGEAPSIENFIAGTGAVDQKQNPRVEITADINVPAGIAPASISVNPVRLIIDGKAKVNASNLLLNNGPGKYTLRYFTAELGAGRHKATLAVHDAADRWAEADLEFKVETNVAATLSAAVAEEGNVNLELASALDSASEKTLIVEQIDGQVARRVKSATFPMELTLAPGVYRAYVQLQSETAVTSTPKTEIIVD